MKSSNFEILWIARFPCIMTALMGCEQKIPKELTLPTLNAGLAEIFSTRSFHTGQIAVAGGDQTVGTGVEIYANLSVPEPWLITKNGRDLRNHSPIITDRVSLEQRWKFRHIVENYSEALHIVADKDYPDRPRGSTGRTSLIASALFCTPIYHVWRNPPAYDADNVDLRHLMMGEFGIGPAYVSHVLLSRGQSPNSSFSPADATDFTITSGILIGQNTVCPIHEEPLKQLFFSFTGLKSSGESTNTDDLYLNGDELRVLLKLANFYEQYRLASAIPWTIKPEGLDWRDWKPKPDTVDPTNYQNLIQIHNDVKRLLGYHPGIPYISPDEIRAMRTAKTVNRDDLLKF